MGVDEVAVGVGADGVLEHRLVNVIVSVAVEVVCVVVLEGLARV